MKIYVVTFGQWEYEACNETRRYFASRKSALMFALSLRRDKSDVFYSLPFDRCARYGDKIFTSWSIGDYSGIFISVDEEDVSP